MTCHKASGDRAASQRTHLAIALCCFASMAFGPGSERQPREKLEPSPERQLGLLHRWRDEAVIAGIGRPNGMPVTPK